MLATLLGRACATAVTRLEARDDGVRCHREVEGGTEVVDLPLPCVATITKGTYEPRYATLKGIMAARRKPLERRRPNFRPRVCACSGLSHRLPGRRGGSWARAPMRFPSWCGCCGRRAGAL